MVIPVNVKNVEIAQQINDNKIEKTVKEKIDFVEIAYKFVDEQPMYFDKAGLWWMWDEKKWIMCDETDILHSVINAFNWVGVTNQGVKSQFMTALKIVARTFPIKIPEYTLILTESGIYNIITEELSEAKPEYFFTNYIPHKIGNIIECQSIDMLLKEWVGEENIEKLYDIMAYCLLRNYNIHRIFFLLGQGSNGKGSFIRLLIKLLGQDNCTSFGLKRLSDDKFQAAKLYQKLIAVATEIDYDILENTSLTKAISGGDPISCEFKNHTPFDFFNYAKIFIATNSIPATKDRTEGFYRRMEIIDFPNRFADGKEITEKIDEDVFETLLYKLLKRLPRIVEEGNIIGDLKLEEKTKRYEAKSNPIKLFIESYCQKKYDEYIIMTQFFQRFSAWCSQNGYRKYNKSEVYGLLDLIGYERGYHKFRGEEKEWGARCVEGLCWKENVSDVSDVSLLTTLSPYIRKEHEYHETSETSETNIEKLKEWMKNDMFYFQNLIGVIADIYKCDDQQAEVILNDLVQKSILFEPQSGRYKVL